MVLFSPFHSNTKSEYLLFLSVFEDAQLQTSPLYNPVAVHLHKMFITGVEKSGNPDDCNFRLVYKTLDMSLNMN